MTTSFPATNFPATTFPDYDALSTDYKETYQDLIGRIVPSCSLEQLQAIGYIIYQYNKQNSKTATKRKGVPPVPFGGERGKNANYTKFYLEELPQPLCGKIYSYLTSIFQVIQ